jgi:predicted Zn-dependent protease
MLGKNEIRKIIKEALKYSKADQKEITVFNDDQALTRFANNYIHQNVRESNTNISVRVAFGKKIGYASTNSLSLKRVKEAVAWADRIAQFQKENVYFKAFPHVTPDKYRKVLTVDSGTVTFSPPQRAEAVAEIVDIAKKYGLMCYGSVSNGSGEIAIGNSSGTFAYAVSGDIFCNIVMTGTNSTGYVQAGNRDVNRLSFRALAETAALKAINSVDPVALSPGRYTTIFEPLAAREFIDFMGYYAFNGKAFEEKRSFLTDKLGKKIVDPRITICDEPFKKYAFPFPFDFEGVPKKRLILIDHGIARNVVYDTLTAAQAKTRSTGHGLSAPNPFGPIPMHMVMKGGEKPVSQMISETERGILVTRFHYTNILDPHTLVFTGMTRDGTFLIENGVLTKGVKNFRFTENIIDCFNRVESISKKSHLVASDPGYGSRFATGAVVPTLKINDFTFSGVTKF